MQFVQVGGVEHGAPTAPEGLFDDNKVYPVGEFVSKLALLPQDQDANFKGTGLPPYGQNSR